MNIIAVTREYANIGKLLYTCQRSDAAAAAVDGVCCQSLRFSDFAITIAVKGLHQVCLEIRILKNQCRFGGKGELLAVPSAHIVLHVRAYIIGFTGSQFGNHGLESAVLTDFDNSL